MVPLTIDEHVPETLDVIRLIVHNRRAGQHLSHFLQGLAIHSRLSFDYLLSLSCPDGCLNRVKDVPFDSLHETAVALWQLALQQTAKQVDVEVLRSELFDGPHDTRRMLQSELLQAVPLVQEGVHVLFERLQRHRSGHTLRVVGYFLGVDLIDQVSRLLQRQDSRLLLTGQ